MVGLNDIVITGIGCVTPLGIGLDDFRRSLLEGRCAIERYVTLSDPLRTTFYAARIGEFDGKQYVTPRKALKVMGREVQIAYSSAHLAWQDAGLTDFAPVPERVGVVYGTEMLPGDIADMQSSIQACVYDQRMDYSQWGKAFSSHIFPLWMLKYLPNMPACHVGIAVDARGPNNSLAMEEASGLLALGEAASVIRRGAADLMIVGACGVRTTPTRMIYRAPGLYDQHPASPLANDESSTAQLRSIAFDARRHGIVPSEGAVTLIIESRSHAMQRGAKILAVLAGHSSRYGRPAHHYGGSQTALVNAARDCMNQADITASDLAHISAQGFSAQATDIEEAEAIAQIAPDVPVTAFSSYFGTAGAACGLMELAASIIAVRAGMTLPTLGYSQPDPRCAIQVCTQPQRTQAENVLKLSFTLQGQAAAVVVQCMR